VGSPLIVEDKVYIGDEGEVSVFKQPTRPGSDEGRFVRWLFTARVTWDERLRHLSWQGTSLHRQPDSPVAIAGRKMKQRVLDVGNCGPDHSSIRHFSQALRVRRPTADDRPTGWPVAGW
jgi:hypothetical protein